jgi:hypothetical protein
VGSDPSSPEEKKQMRAYIQKELQAGGRIGVDPLCVDAASLVTPTAALLREIPAIALAGMDHWQAGCVEWVVNRLGFPSEVIADACSLH